MKLDGIKRILEETLGGDVPKAVKAMLQPLNGFIEQVATALSGRLTFEENFLSKKVQQKFSHGVESELNPTIDIGKNLRVTGVLPTSSGGLLIDKFGWRQKDNGNIGVTFYFSTATEATCTVIILLG